jgi:stearoyl-CoA 9-desaturase NADPH oxidoreductase
MAVTETLRSGAWRVVEMLTTPLVPADYLDVVAPLRNGGVLRARVQAVRPETRSSVTLVLRPGRGWRPHLPGQYIRLGVDVDGVRLWRSYSVTSVPGGRLSVTVNAVKDGLVSTHLVRNAKAGMILHLDRPAGDFVLPTPRPGKVLFVTAGSGITPVMGMLRSALHELSDVVVVHSAPAHEDVVFGAELRTLAADGRIRLIERHTRTDGRITPETLAETVPDLWERETWACGPNDLLDAMTAHWSRAGVAEKLHVERFRPTFVVTGDGGKVTFEKTGTVIDADGAVPILEAAESAGMLMPSGCRMGICFKCVLPLREGAIRDLRDGSVTIATEGDNVIVQTCISAAAGPCHIDF